MNPLGKIHQWEFKAFCWCCFCKSVNVLWILIDESCLDFWYWGAAQAYVYEHKPKTITELKSVVEDFNASLTSNDIRKALQNMRKRAEFCLQYDGKHFEQHLKFKNPPASETDWFQLCQMICFWFVSHM